MKKQDSFLAKKEVVYSLLCYGTNEFEKKEFRFEENI